MKPLTNLYEKGRSMYSIALYSNILTEKIYNIYMKLYFAGLVSQPIIYTNSCRIPTQGNIPIFYVKYIFNKHYDIIIADMESRTDTINMVCDKLVIVPNNSTAEDIINKIQEIIKC